MGRVGEVMLGFLNNFGDDLMNGSGWKFAVGVPTSIAVVLMISAAGATSLGDKPYDPTLMAAWVQAVGSVAAIVGAIWIGQWQIRETRELQQSLDRATLERRWSSVKAVVDSLYQQCVDVTPVFDGDHDFGTLAFAFRFQAMEYERSVARLDAIPLFELDSAALVSAVIGLQRHAVSLQGWIEEGVLRQYGPGKVEEAGDALIKQLARDHLHFMREHYREVIEVTGGAPITAPRPTFHMYPARDTV